MKKWVTYLLLISLLGATVVPCSIFDECNKEQCAEDTSAENSGKDCNGCSPFSICTSTYVNIIHEQWPLLEAMVVDVTVEYGEYFPFFKSEYYVSLLQPPRLG